MATKSVPSAGSPSQEADSARTSKFRFKTKRQNSETHDSEDGLNDERRTKRRKHGHSSSSHHHRSRRNRSHASPLKDDPTLYDDTYQQNSRSSRYMDPDAAFRESLFDALADDEGAAYWEGVYGQPIHVYPDTKVGPDGELERMTDEEYAEHVRRRMWEKSHEHIMEERRRREEMRQKERERERRKRKEDPEKLGFSSKIDDALLRGESRKRDREWKETWLQYTAKWERLLHNSLDGQQDPIDPKTGPLIPWPVESGKRKDVEKNAVETFFQRSRPDDLETVLKLERVRWHPDKMQHRFRGQSLDADTLQAVTAVFQIVDTAWKGLKGAANS